MKIYNLSYVDARRILEKLDNKFGLVYANKGLSVIGNTITATVKKQSENRFSVEIQSSYFADSTIMSELEEYDDEYFLVEKS